MVRTGRPFSLILPRGCLRLIASSRLCAGDPQITAPRATSWELFHCLPLTATFCLAKESPPVGTCGYRRSSTVNLVPAVMEASWGEEGSAKVPCIAEVNRGSNLNLPIQKASRNFLEACGSSAMAGAEAGGTRILVGVRLHSPVPLRTVSTLAGNPSLRRSRRR